ncbi:hypothetical protein ACTFIZ_003421 [Dictyostelium cf. discoideum]
MDNDELFFKIWRNKYIRLIITNFRILYEKNKKVKFYNYKEFRGYKEKEFVLKIDYHSDELLKDGDLSQYEMVRIIKLREPIFNNVSWSIFENTLIEKIKFPTFKYNRVPPSTDINKLPNTVNSIKQFPYDLNIPILRSIKKITISSDYHNDFLNAKYLKFSENENITNLKINSSWSKNYLRGYSKILNENVLPITLEKLIFSSGNSITLYSNKLLSLNNLTHLSISHQNVLLEPNSIPPSVTFLSIINLGNPIVDDSIIPRNLKTLIINPTLRPDFKYVSIQHDALPNSLTYLKCDCCILDIPENIKNDNNICFFLKSIKSLSIGSNFKSSPSSSSSSLCNITSITFGYHFNKTILPNILPKSLTFLKQINK